MDFFSRITHYQQLLFTYIKKDLRGRYKRSVLGIFWSFLNPLLMLSVYALVFPYLLKINEKNYVVFLILGIVPWNFFINSINMSTVVIINNGSIIKKIFFPREILPLSLTITNLIDLLISTIIVFVFVIASRIELSWIVLLFPFILFIQFLFTLSLVFVVSALTVYLRDLTYIMNFILLIMFYLTPVVYSLNMFPTYIKNILYLNPMAWIIDSYRAILYLNTLPNLKALFVLLIIGLISVSLAYKIFRKLEKGFAEEL